MEMLDNLALGFSVAFSLSNILYCLIGVTVGTAIGVLPGVGPAVTIAVLLPITFGMPAASAIIMLAGIYYGAQYGGSTTSILVNMPGEASSVVTCIDGYQMTLQGRAGVALATAALSSFFAGTVSTVFVAFFAPALSVLALDFRSPEYFSIALFALVLCSALVQRGMVKGLLMAAVGIFLGTIGIDVQSGVARYTFGMYQLSNGVPFSVVAIGLFAFSETIVQLGSNEARDIAIRGKLTRLMPRLSDLKGFWAPTIRGTVIGSFFGVLPGTGGTITSFAAYVAEKRLSKTPERFGKGAIEGVAGPEAANNAASQCSFIPTLTLGIPGSVTMAFMMGALLIQNIQPGPGIITKYPELFWGLVVSMWLGNLLLVILNLPLVGVWVSMLRVPYRLFFPAILVFSCVGTLSINNSPFDIMLLALFGAAGYVLAKLEFELAPLALGFILAPLLEENLRRSLLLSRGDFTVFVTNPLSAVFFLTAVGMLCWMLFTTVRPRRSRASL